MTKQRPTVVTAACAIMFGIAAVNLCSTVLKMVAIELARGDALANPNEAAVHPHHDEVTSSIFALGAVFTAGCGLFVTLGYATLAYFNLRGNNGVRIATWVVSGVLGLFELREILTSAAHVVVRGEPEQLTESVEEAMPWFAAVLVAVPVLTLFGYIAVVVLLALPAANAYFRPARPQWQPPADLGRVPGMDQSHPQSSQPQPGQPPSQPPFGQPPYGPNPPQL